MLHTCQLVPKMLADITSYKNVIQGIVSQYEGQKFDLFMFKDRSINVSSTNGKNFKSTHWDTAMIHDNFFKTANQCGERFISKFCVAI